MLSLKAHLWILFGIVAALVALIACAGILQATGMKEAPPAWRLPGLILVFGLFVAIGFAAVPVMVKLVLGFQRTVGNAEVGPVKAVLALENVLIWGMWALMAAGLVIAIPAAIAGGLFKEEAQTATTVAAPGPSEGVLSARPGMTLAEMARGSTLKLDIVARDGGPAPVVAGGGVFDFRVPGSSVVFRGCRYYYVSTFTHDREHIQGMSIGTASRKLARAELDAADEVARVKLAADGWLAGHEVYRDEEDRTLHGGLSEGPEGNIWLKDGVVLNLQSKRMDEPAAGEDAAAGEWIQYIDLWSKADYPWVERYAFAPYRGGAASTGRP